MSPNAWGRGGSGGVSANEYSCTQEPKKINFGDLTPYRPEDTVTICDPIHKIARNAKRLIEFVPRIGDDDSLCQPGRKPATPGSNRDAAGAAPGCARDACATSCSGWCEGPAAPRAPGPTSLVENGRLSLQLAPRQKVAILSRSCYDANF
jgi:hypothetical protein